jgi:hypothetical protein
LEHRLILGGEQFLPFARSRIKALRATGLRYASQQFEIDGCSVKVRVDGEHEFIRLEGGSNMMMDSGIVDLIEWNPEHTNSFLPGVLYESSDVAAYNAKFIAKPDAPDTRRFHKGPGSYAGELTFTNTVKGALNPDESPAESFAPEWVADPSTTPPGKMRNPASDALIAKKVTAAFVPAAIFTGRCRLYVQAMYGRALYNSKGVVNDYPALGAGLTGSTPYLQVRAYNAPGDTTDYGPIDVTTSTGVYLDPLTSKHWMLYIGYGELRVYPLKAPASVEAKRAMLRGPTMTQEDKDHLEAYILGYCLPDARRVQVVDLGAGLPGYSMGYGWHWNYSGTAADIVYNTPFEYEPGNALSPMGMKSSHYQITPSATTDQYGVSTWDAEQACLEFESVWTLDRNRWTVVEPGWGLGVAYKVTHHRFDLDLLVGKTCDAPFYVYYKGDERVLCRAKINHTELAAERTVSDPYFASATPYGEVLATTIGLAGGSCEDKAAFAYYSATFTVGDYATPELKAISGRSTRKVACSEKAGTGVWSPRWAVSWGANTLVTEGTWPNLTTTDVGFGGQADGASENMSYTLSDISGTETENSYCAVIVPQNDAEAVYVTANTSRSASATGTKYDVANQTVGGTVYEANWHRRMVVYQYFGPEAYYYRFEPMESWPGSGFTYTTDGSYSENTSSVLHDESFLLCRSGRIDTPIPDINQLFSVGPDELIQEYYAQSGTRDSSAVVQWLDPKYTATGSLPDTALPVFVGWI